jgi:hypothetical protein
VQEIDVPQVPPKEASERGNGSAENQSSSDEADDNPVQEIESSSESDSENEARYGDVPKLKTVLITDANNEQQINWNAAVQELGEAININNVAKSFIKKMETFWKASVGKCKTISSVVLTKFYSKCHIFCTSKLRNKCRKHLNIDNMTSDQQKVLVGWFVQIRKYFVSAKAGSTEVHVKKGKTKKASQCLNISACAKSKVRYLAGRSVHKKKCDGLYPKKCWQKIWC